jgi:hypothetical protein
MKGFFLQAFVGRISASGKQGDTICVDDLFKKHSVSFIHLLYSDIQG